jgi:hypothetical protein
MGTEKEQTTLSDRMEALAAEMRDAGHSDKLGTDDAEPLWEAARSVEAAIPLVRSLEAG